MVAADLDGFCLALQRDLHEITAVRSARVFKIAPNSLLQHPNFAPSEYCYTSWNQPFAPSDRTTADEMINDEKNEYHDKGKGLDKIRRMLIHNWRQVDQETRA